MGYRFVCYLLVYFFLKIIIFHFFRIINPAKAMNELGWRPRHVGFVEEVDIYYKSWAAHRANK